MDDAFRLAAERACERLVIAYTHLIDFGEAAQVADLFTEDGVWESDKQRVSGRDQIKAGFVARQNNTRRTSRHVCTNIAIEVVSETEATGITYLTLYRHDGDHVKRGAPLNGPMLLGEYYDRFVLTREGWRIAHRRVKVAFARVSTTSDSRVERHDIAGEGGTAHKGDIVLHSSIRVHIE